MFPERYPSYPQPSDIDGPMPGAPHGRRVPTEDDIAEAREEENRERFERGRTFRRLMARRGDEDPRDSEPEPEEEDDE